MTASFAAYVDESGDEGFKFLPNEQGSSRWFVLSVMVLRSGNDLQVLSSRGPPVRAVAIADNLYKSHAYLRFLF